MRPDGNDLQVLVEGIQVLGGLSWSPDGALLAVSNSRSQDDLSEGLVFMNPDGTNLETVVANNRLNGRAAWSPDSKKVAYIQYTNHGRVIVILDLVAGDSYNIPLNFIVSSVAWSPDGEWIAFSTDNELYKVRLDGSNQIQLVVVDDCIIGYSGISWFSFN
jgi:Tol biopolymer transport system component